MKQPIQPGVAPQHGEGASADEQGYMLLAMVVMVALVLIALAAAAPVVARDLRRDKEVESMHRANQYVRALRMYSKKAGGYPASMEALEKTNNVRYLRKQYIDPLTGKADWRIIHVGENQTTVKGFFGEPLGGLNSTGIGGGMGGAAGNPSGGVNSLAAGFSGGDSSPSGPSGPSGNSPTSGFGSPAGGTGGSSGSSFGSSSSSSGFGSGGVGQIMGVGTSRSGTSILNPNLQTTYETWEFLYDPRIEQMYAKSNILGGGGMGSQSATGMGIDAASGKSVTGATNDMFNQNNPPTGTSPGSSGQDLGSSPGSPGSGFGSTPNPR